MRFRGSKGLSTPSGVTLPHRNPGDVPAWSRNDGNLTMTVRPGWDHERRKMLGYHYGSIPRLLLFWLTVEAVRTRCRIIQLGRSLKHLIETITGLENRGIGFKSLTEAIDTTTSGGKLIFPHLRSACERCLLC